MKAWFPPKRMAVDTQKIKEQESLLDEKEAEIEAPAQTN